MSTTAFAPSAERVSAAMGPSNRLQEVSLAVVPGSPTYLRVRRIIDLALCLPLIVAVLPLVAVLAAAVRATSRGPAFYSQTRLGLFGRPFRIYKLRTMVHDAEAVSGAVWATKRDARVTPFGRVLRETHLDELPQLWNVVCGQMSFVGPRPERPEFVRDLQWKLPCYTDRLRVPPGVTGLAQLKLPPDSDLASVGRKLAYDLYYVRNAGLWLDLRLIAATAGYFVKAVAWSVAAVFALPSHEAVVRCVADEAGDETCRSLVGEFDEPAGAASSNFLA